jgi:pimeloyl-ACP methyl ester carboxylesterase
MASRLRQLVLGVSLLVASATLTSPSADASTASPSIVQVPVQVAHTSDGSVGYRIIGKGSPLVLITGFSASMDNWAPPFVNTLAAKHRVVIFDNAGVGQTAALASPLTITAMAAQTSALISTLKLGRTAVLGWSMGGMIAQALAVRHPSQVSRLILAATQAGNGKAIPPPAAAAATLNSGNPLEVLNTLFPADQKVAEGVYEKAILTYPNFYLAPATAQAAQNQAIDQWFAGKDPAGVAAARLHLPTLVADGKVDALDPVSNDHQLAGLIRGAHLMLYPDAGHAFLFQEAGFAATVDRFLNA